MSIAIHIAALERLERQGTSMIKQMDLQAQRKDYSALAATLKKVKDLNKRVDQALKAEPKGKGQ